MARTAMFIAATTAFGSIHAQTSGNAEPTDDLKFRLVIYGWLPDVGGTTTFPQDDGGEVSTRESSIIDNLKMAFMGSLGVQRGQWGAFTDVIYLDFGNTQSSTRGLIVNDEPLPIGAAAKAELDLKGWSWTLAGSYLLRDESNGDLEVFAGARLLDLKTTLDWQFSGDVGSIPVLEREGSGKATLSNVDAIAGVKGNLMYGADHQWFTPYYLDVGAGQSDVTWQAMAGIGRSFRWGDVIVAWRYLDYDLQSGSGIQNVDFNGPGIAAAFRW
jgi:hypothetical protein